LLSTSDTLNEIDNIADIFLQEKPICADETAIEMDIWKEYFTENGNELKCGITEDSSFEEFLNDVFDDDVDVSNCSCSSSASSSDYDEEGDSHVVKEYQCTPLEDVQQDLKERFPSAQAFPWKLYDMLQDAEIKGLNDVISWWGHGFKVHKLQDFVKSVLPLYFHQTKYQSFRRQLNFYGFLRVHDDQGMYHHKEFVRGDRSRCCFIHRRVPTTNCRKHGDRI